MVYAPNAFNMLPLIMFLCLGYGLLQSESDLAVRGTLWALSIPLLSLYYHARISISNVLLTALGLFWFFALVPTDFVIKSFVVLGLAAYSLWQYIPMEYLFILAAIVLITFYATIFIYIAFTTFGMYETSMALTLLYLAWMYALRTRPPIA